MFLLQVEEIFSLVWEEFFPHLSKFQREDRRFRAPQIDICKSYRSVECFNEVGITSEFAACSLPYRERRGARAARAPENRRTSESHSYSNGRTRIHKIVVNPRPESNYSFRFGGTDSFLCYWERPSLLAPPTVTIY